MNFFLYCNQNVHYSCHHPTSCAINSPVYYQTLPPVVGIMRKTSTNTTLLPRLCKRLNTLESYIFGEKEGWIVNLLLDI